MNAFAETMDELTGEINSIDSLVVATTVPGLSKDLIDKTNGCLSQSAHCLPCMTPPPLNSFTLKGMVNMPCHFEHILFSGPPTP